MTLDTSIWEWWRVWWLWWWRDQILLVLFLPVKEGGMRDLKVFSIVLQVWSQSFSMYQPSNAHCASSLLPFQCKMQLKISTLYPLFPMRLLLVKSCSWSCYSHSCCHFSSNSMSVHHFGYPSFVTTPHQAPSKTHPEMVVLSQSQLTAEKTGVQTGRCFVYEYTLYRFQC